MMDGDLVDDRDFSDPGEFEVMGVFGVKTNFFPSWRSKILTLFFSTKTIFFKA